MSRIPTDRIHLPAFDGLEGRQLLSAAHFDHIVLRQVPAPLADVVLDGGLSGTSYSVKSSTTRPETLRMGFEGTVGSLGPVHAVLTERVEFATSQIVSGSLLLKGARGSVNLIFGASGVVENSYTADGSTTIVNARVRSGTGPFTHATGTETLTVATHAGDPTRHLTLSSKGG